MNENREDREQGVGLAGHCLGEHRGPTSPSASATWQRCRRPNYRRRPQRPSRSWNNALATELVCVLRYKFHYVAAQGIDSEAIKAEFLEHANEEQAHADRIAERINQLGGKPNFDPTTLAARSATQFREVDSLVEMVKDDLVAERIAIEVYRDMIRFFGNRRSFDAADARGNPRARGRAREHDA